MPKDIILTVITGMIESLMHYLKNTNSATIALFATNNY